MRCGLGRLMCGREEGRKKQKCGRRRCCDGVGACIGACMFFLMSYFFCSFPRFDLLAPCRAAGRTNPSKLPEARSAEAADRPLTPPPRWKVGARSRCRCRRSRCHPAARQVRRRLRCSACPAAPRLQSWRTRRMEEGRGWGMVVMWRGGTSWRARKQRKRGAKRDV